MRHVVMLRGVNVGGRNKVPMAALAALLSEEFEDVQTYIQSGNAVLTSPLTSARVAERVEQLLATGFALDTSGVRALALDRRAFGQVMAQAPPEFGADDATYRYDVAFFMGVKAADVRPFVSVHPDVDDVTWGTRAFYHRRVVAQATKSRVARNLLSSPVYPSLTIRNWRTTATLAQMISE